MTRFLVTGAAGFVGSNLVRALLDRGHQVRGVDNFATGRRENVFDESGYEFVEGDIRDPDCTAQIVQEIDYVLHQAAVPSVPRSVADPLQSHDNNATATLILLEACRQASNIKRFVFASSSSVYGDTPTLPKEESMNPRPMSPYAVSKLMTEHYASVYVKLHRLPCVGLRYFNVFGPRQDPQGAYAAVIPRFIDALAQGNAPTVYGDGTQTRDFTYVDNVIDANLAACESDAAVGNVYNIAGSEPVSLNDLLGTMKALMKSEVTPSFESARSGDIKHSWADNSAAKRDLDFQIRVSLQEGIERTIAWYAQR